MVFLHHGLNVVIGIPALLYFGFMTCPAICPTDLAKMARISRQLQQQQGLSVRPIFVTIDPERDTPKKLKTYVNYFASDFVGLTGAVQDIVRITDAYHVYYKKVPTGDKPDEYMMDHSTILFLIDSQGRYLKHFVVDWMKRKSKDRWRWRCPTHRLNGGN